MYYQALVNKKHKIKEEMFTDRVLVTTKNIDEEEIQVEKKTYEAYQKLKEALRKERKLELGILSAYRSLEEQQQVLEDYMIKYGEEYAKKIVAPVGCSEHHTGLCIDFAISKNKKFMTNNHELMKDENRYQSITPYLVDFGFILRYPKGKEEVTGYPYEPWHIRYVGKHLAKKLYEENITLEEYYQNLSGVLVVNKEKNMTSRDVVNIVGNYFYTKKVGHTGTLDPLATGVLVLTLGKATKISEMLTSTYKEYIATSLLGLKTDTLDITGKVLKESIPPKNINLEETLKSFQKTYLQEVPLYSAVKVNGKKLYEYARENKPVILPKKEVTVKEIELLNQEKDTFTFRTIVSKGCYIRSLIEDIATSLNTYATMTELIRTKQGSFTLGQASTLREIKEGKANILPIEQALNYPRVIVDSKEAQKVKNGAFLKNSCQILGPCLILDEKTQLLAIYEGKKEKLIAKKVLTNTKE